MKRRSLFERLFGGLLVAVGIKARPRPLTLQADNFKVTIFEDGVWTLTDRR